MDGRLTWPDCDKAGDYVVPNVLSPRDLVFRPDNMDETVPHTYWAIETKNQLIVCGKEQVTLESTLPGTTNLD